MCPTSAIAPDAGVGLLSFVDLQRELSGPLGLSVDPHTPASPSHFLGARAVASAEVAYAA